MSAFYWYKNLTLNLKGINYTTLDIEFKRRVETICELDTAWEYTLEIKRRVIRNNYQKEIWDTTKKSK